MSHILIVRLIHKAFVCSEVISFDTTIYHEKLSFVKNGVEILLTITGLRAKDKKVELLRSILDILFIYLGAFPHIELIKYDKEDIDISKWVLKYNTRNDLERSDLLLCAIDSATVNENRIRALNSIPDMPLYSLQYLVSEVYRHTISDHKITLMLHVIEGMVLEDESTQGGSEWKKKYGHKSDGKIGRYRSAVYYLCSRYFYAYHRKYNCEILKLLKKDQFSFVETITDTRNWYSHFLGVEKKPYRMHNGIEMQIYFEIIYYAVRLMCLSRLGVMLSEDRTREYFYTVHDWILKIKYNREDDLKSKTYKSIQDHQKFLRAISSYGQ